MMKFLYQMFNETRMSSSGAGDHLAVKDAHEFIRYAIDTLQSVCVKEVGTNATNFLEEETTLIGLLPLGVI
ncbi:putative ubiquitinyl hydrolase 1 [Helianthus annuus]|uniref:Ubiquitinyl hydrolase 1 n=1 Tax=Helianthus annuus TaxID=4232 RepID=A0A251RRH2_HELAN|nr:putative ubiquitinyl hydrolase 1 [Helianthus annuus]KAJ0474020.1 putative ubiquitinyl hydrolase 1 [Helianthus annuus]KAJ0832322.1 putative ubiquitinyl hydrolase 1 [Helianthus annuus]